VCHFRRFLISAFVAERTKNMKRFTGRAWVAIAGVAIVIAMAQVAAAQREEGGRGRGGRGFGRGGGFRLTTVRLATAEEVQAALGLSDEQKTKVADINEEFRDQQRELFRQGGGDPREIQEEAQKLNQEAAAKLAEALDATQNKRLLGILAQVDVDAALGNADISKELDITEEQKESLAEVRRSNGEAMDEARQEMRDQDLSPEEMTAKMDELRTEASKKLLAALSSDQQAKFEALKGEPVRIDMAQFRMFGGGRGGRGGRDGARGEGGGRRGQRGEGGAAESDRGA
jgi:hypothetical protein